MFVRGLHLQLIVSFYNQVQCIIDQSVRWKISLNFFFFINWKWDVTPVRVLYKISLSRIENENEIEINSEFQLAHGSAFLA